MKRPNWPPKIAEKIVRLWRLCDSYVVSNWREAESLAAAIGAATRRVWSVASAELGNVLPRLVRAGAFVYIF